MLFRLILVAVVVGLSVVAFRTWRARAALAGRTLSGEEQARFKALAARADSVEEALALREKIRRVRGGEAATAARDGVEEAVRELALKAELIERLAHTADELEGDASEEEIRAARAEAEAATTDDARELAADRAAVLERQRSSAAELRKRRDELLRTNERILLSLREVHVALLELEASAGSDASPTGVRAKLVEASEELRRRAAAQDEVKAFLDAAKKG